MEGQGKWLKDECEWRKKFSLFCFLRSWSEKLQGFFGLLLLLAADVRMRTEQLSDFSWRNLTGRWLESSSHWLNYFYLNFRLLVEWSSNKSDLVRTGDWHGRRRQDWHSDWQVVDVQQRELLHALEIGMIVNLSATAWWEATIPLVLFLTTLDFSLTTFQFSGNS